MSDMLTTYCKQLKLAVVPDVYSDIDYQNKGQYLTKVLEKEIHAREQTKIQRLLKRAGFLNPKTLAGYSFEPITWPKPESKNALLNLSFVERCQNVLMLGAVGTGKTHLAKALGAKACAKGFNVRFFRAVDLVNTLSERHQRGTLGRFLRELANSALLIIDELGFVPFHRDGAELLFNVIADCYEQQSVIVTSNLEFGQWNEIFGDSRLTAALIDRLVHHAHILAFTGESFRLQKAMHNSANLSLNTTEQINEIETKKT